MIALTPRSSSGFTPRSPRTGGKLRRRRASLKATWCRSGIWPLTRPVWKTPLCPGLPGSAQWGLSPTSLVFHPPVLLATNQAFIWGRAGQILGREDSRPQTGERVQRVSRPLQAACSARAEGRSPVDGVTVRFRVFASGRDGAAVSGFAWTVPVHTCGLGQLATVALFPLSVPVWTVRGHPENRRHARGCEVGGRVQVGGG